MFRDSYQTSRGLVHDKLNSKVTISGLLNTFIFTITLNKYNS